MQKRICPNCFARWYSSDTRNVWKCEICKSDIPVPKEELFLENVRIEEEYKIE